MTPKQTAVAAALALCVAGAAFTVFKLRGEHSVSPFAMAKTIQVHEVYTKGSQRGGRSTPSLEFDVKIARPNNIKILVTQGQDKTGILKPHQYVSDGMVEREYNGDNNTFTVANLPADGKSRSRMRGMSMVDMYLSENSAPEEGATRTISTEMIDDQAYKVISDQRPSKTSRGEPYTFTEQMWINQRTQLPYKDVFMTTRNGRIQEVGRITFSNWVFNKPIAPDQLAWNPPTNAKAYTKPQLLSAGSAAPDFTVFTSAGKTTHLSDFKGKIVILDLWATWCVPCQASMPHLNKVYAATKNQGVQVLAVCVWDKKDAYAKWNAEKASSFQFPTYFDPAPNNDSSFASIDYGVTGIPTQYVIDKDGKIAAAIAGYDDSHQLEDALTKLGVTLPKLTASTDIK
ncbi:MAG: redoxin domain-containing protein [Capsulimonas sp.]|uniref:redoxin domain-containing protein n=1 Tax=Capsulimonas sp. TaxID=2494211 RepID=UPI0032675DC8